MNNDFYTYLLNRYGLSDDRLEQNQSPTLGNQYIVESGDNLYDIAKRFHTTINQLRALNNLPSNLIHPGQILIIDDNYTPGKVEEAYKEYMVKPNDTVYSIAYNFDMTVNELAALNNLIDYEIYPGQKLIVYNVPEELTNNNIYIVKKGDSLYQIANHFRTTVDSLIKLNNLSSDELNVGDQLIIYDDINQKPGIKSISRYTVLPGDSIYKIAIKKGTTVKRIMDLNNLTSNRLYIGQELLIPE